MIQANELRIGNYINIDGDFVTAESITNVGIWYIGKNLRQSSEFMSNIKPIELTEEILLKCGFERDNGVMCYTVDDFSDVKIVYETLANYYRLYPYTYNIKYLHNLQNIFYSITGQELEIIL